MRDLKPDKQARPESALELMGRADLALTEGIETWLSALDDLGAVDPDAADQALDDAIRAAVAAKRALRYEALDLAMAAECGDRIAAALTRDPDPDEPQHDDIDEWARDLEEDE